MKKHVAPACGLQGRIKVPADKSIAQRAALFALLTKEPSCIANYPLAEDPQTALACTEKLGARVSRKGDEIRVRGVGRNGLAGPDIMIDCGNSGTVMRMLSGILAGAGRAATLAGDKSLSRRPMKRIIDPLEQMGARIRSSVGGYPPLHVSRNQHLKPIDFLLPVPSAQLKSCVLLAGLFGESPTRVTEPVASRNHTEIMLQLPTHREGGMHVITSSALQFIPAQNLTVPGDFSAAAFWLVAGSIVENSDIILPDTGVNPTRSAALDILRRMGADIRMEAGIDVNGFPPGYRTRLQEEQQKEQQNDRNKTPSETEQHSRMTPPGDGEPVAGLRVRTARLNPTEIQPHEIPIAIDELPVLCVAMAFADGVSRITGAAELRHKETDRLAAIQAILEAGGVRVEALQDGLVIHGDPERIIHPARHDSRHDHRMAMSAAILSLRAASVSEIDHAEAASVSYPSFWSHLDSLAHI
ncbi:MAG: 3-phosphoshikimate 1-carboxyvinyltransferase [Cyclonatronaceae bacterium]